MPASGAVRSGVEWSGMERCEASGRMSEWILPPPMHRFEHFWPIVGPAEPLDAFSSSLYDGLYKGLYGWIDEWMEGWMVGRTDDQTDRCTMGWICAYRRMWSRSYIATFPLRNKPVSGAACSGVERSGAERSRTEWCAVEWSKAEWRAAERSNAEQAGEWVSYTLYILLEQSY